MRKNKAVAKGDSSTPATSRKVYTFSKWLTAGDQIELVQKDMESSKRFSVKRSKLSGLEQEPGSLVIGVTAITFLNLNDQICYVHPYQILSRYLKSEAGFEYSLDAKHKGARYVFQVAADQNVDEIVTEIDKRSLRLEKSLAAGKAVPSASPLKSPRGGGGSDAPKSPRGGAKSPRGGPEPSVPVFDPDVVPVSNPKPTQKVSQVAGSRFRVKMILDDGTEHRAVAIISPEALTIIDPSTSTGGNANSVHYRSAKWSGVTSITSKQNLVKVITSDNTLMELLVEDSTAFIEELNRQRDIASNTVVKAPEDESTTDRGSDPEDDSDCEVMKW